MLGLLYFDFYFDLVFFAFVRTSLPSCRFIFAASNFCAASVLIFRRKNHGFSTRLKWIECGVQI
ncbi:MAG: hypothetical protein Q7U12_05020, partial [Undibacterium sp.]|nr:hypothetical protein [Undibacterium sp.]